MAVIEDEVGDDLSGSGFLTEEGIYLFVVTQTDCPVLNKDGAITDALFKIYAEVVAGSVVGQEGRTWSAAFYPAKPDATDNSRELKTKQRSRFYLAINQITDLEKGQGVKVDTDNFTGEYFIAKLEKNKKDAKFLDIAGYGLDVYHIDDVAVAPFLKAHGKPEILSLIHPTKRRIGSRAPAPKPTAKKEPQQAIDYGKF